MAAAGRTRPEILNKVVRVENTDPDYFGMPHEKRDEPEKLPRFLPRKWGKKRGNRSVGQWTGRY